MKDKLTLAVALLFSGCGAIGACPPAVVVHHNAVVVTPPVVEAVVAVPVLVAVPSYGASYQPPAVQAAAPAAPALTAADVRAILRDELGKAGGAAPKAPADAPRAEGPARASLSACVACHTRGREAKSAPTLFDEAGVSLMTDRQIRKATSMVKNRQMPPADAKPLTDEAAVDVLDALDDLQGVEEKKTP